MTRASDSAALRIGEVAARLDVSVQTLRYYERRGLLPPPGRRASGYRAYGEEAVTRVRFVRRAQALGFSLEEISGLLALSRDAGRSCTTVERRATETLRRIDGQLRELRRMRRALSRYVDACRHHEALSPCPLLDALGHPERNGKS